MSEIISLRRDDYEIIDPDFDDLDEDRMEYEFPADQLDFDLEPLTWLNSVQSDTMEDFDA